jgi:hypothetical protein
MAAPFSAVAPCEFAGRSQRQEAIFLSAAWSAGEEILRSVRTGGGMFVPATGMESCHHMVINATNILTVSRCKQRRSLGTEWSIKLRGSVPKKALVRVVRLLR